MTAETYYVDVNFTSTRPLKPGDLEDVFFDLDEYYPAGGLGHDGRSGTVTLVLTGYEEDAAMHEAERLVGDELETHGPENTMYALSVGNVMSHDEISSYLEEGADWFDPIEHPAHYNAYPVEVIELTEHMNFNRGNVVKYIARAGLKDPNTELEDLKKAQWYLDREIDRITR